MKQTLAYKYIMNYYLSIWGKLPPTETAPRKSIVTAVCSLEKKRFRRYIMVADDESCTRTVRGSILYPTRFQL